MRFRLLNLIASERTYTDDWLLNDQLHINDDGEKTNGIL